MAREKLGEFEERGTSGAMLWKHSATFAEISARKDCMVVAFASDALHSEWEPAKILRTSKNRAAHYFEVTDSTSFPELIARIAEAYALAQSTRPRRQTAETPSCATVDEYLARFSGPVREVLEQVRETIRKAAPDAEERISWQMPTFRQGENLVHFAAAKSHLGFYPGESGVRAFADRLTGCKISKGAVRFPFSEPRKPEKRRKESAGRNTPLRPS